MPPAPLIPLLNFCARTPILVVSGAAMLLLSLLGFPALEQALGAPILDVQRDGFDRDGLTVLMSAYGADGRSLHALVTGTMDMAYPLAYGALFVGISYRMTPRWWWLVVVPVLLVVVDVAENIQHILLLTQYPNLGDAQIAAASFSVQLKNVLAQAMILTGLFSIAAGGFMRLRGMSGR